MSAIPPSKRKRTELSLEEKIKLIRESESVPKPTLKVLGEKYGIGKSTVADIIKKKETFKKHWENNAASNKLRLGYDAKYERLNELVWQWFCVVRAKNMPVSGPIIKEKALQFANELEISEFKASNGWLDKWKDRHSIKEFKVSGESAGVDQNVVENFKSRIPEIVGNVFSDWLKKLNSDMRKQGRKILLLLDNASSHGKESDYNLSNVSIKFLPANTTSQLQPLDQVIIRAFKAYYRKYMLQSLLSQMDSAPSVTELCKTVTLLDAINWSVQAWDSVKVETVKKCFLSVGFSATYQISNDDDEDDDEDDDVPLAVLVEQFRYTMQNLEDFDSDVPTEDDSEQWEVNLVQSFKDNESNDEQTDIEQDDFQDDLPGSELSHKDVLDMLIRIKNFAMPKDSDFLKSVQGLQTLAEKKIVKTKCIQKQATLDSFFKKC